MSPAPSMFRLLFKALVVAVAGLSPLYAFAKDEGQAAKEALAIITQQCAAAAPAAGTNLKLSTVKYITGTGSVNASGKCYFANGAYQGDYAATVDYQTLCLSRPEETNWGGAERVCHDGCAYGRYRDNVIGVYYSTLNSDTGKAFGVCTAGIDPEPGAPDPGTGPDPGGGVDPGGGGTDPGGGGGTNPGGGGTDPGGGGTDPGGGGTGPGDGGTDPGGGGTDPGGGTTPGTGGGSGSGSTTCAAPPSCSGDQIQCAQLFQQWRAGCQAEGLGGKVTGNPGDCKSTYTCEGNAVACAQVAVVRQQLCGTGQGDGDGTLTGDGTCAQQFVCTGGDPVACAELKQVHMLRCAVEKLTKEGNGDEDYGESLDPADFVGISDGGGIEGLDAGGWLGGGSCPALNNSVLAQMGVKGLDGLCQGAAVLAAYVLFLGWLHAAMILGRSLTGGG